MVVMDVFSRRIIGFGVAAANLDGIRVCRMFDRAIAKQTRPSPAPPSALSTTIPLICDNYGTNKHPAVKRWLAAHPRFRLHFTPTSASWLNLVERWFTLITSQAIRRGSFDSIRRLEQAIMRWLDRWNQNAQPFRWTKSAADIKRSLTDVTAICETRL
jgi:hypothetical protein